MAFQREEEEKTSEKAGRRIQRTQRERSKQNIPARSCKGTSAQACAKQGRKDRRRRSEDNEVADCEKNVKM